MDEKFPIIKYPTNFLDIIKKTPELPLPPKKPIEPPKTLNDSTEGNFGCITFLFIGSIVALIWSFQGNIGMILTAILLVFFSFILFLTSISDKNLAKKKKEEHTNNYPQLLHEFQIENESYPIRLKEHKREVEELNSLTYLTKYRMKLFNDEFRINSDSIFVAEEAVKKGISEDFFFAYLGKVYGEKVLTNQKVIFERNIFFPDFVLIDRDRKLIIDIEIDEPYVGSTGEPIHHEDSNDYIRDSFFVKNGWIVIRFSEQQIIQQPEQCCDTIEQVINEYSHQREIERNEIKITAMNVWTIEEANRMAYRRYRHSYLPPRLQEKLKFESFEESKLINDEKINEWSSRSSRGETFADDLPF